MSVDGLGRTLDDYGDVVRNKRRHPKCRCEVPCVGRFRCTCRAHKGSRSTPFCNGASDNHPNMCDACANLRERQLHAAQDPG